MTVLRSAAVVLSGNELLDGRTTDTNGAFVSADLSDRGVKVASVVTVADDRERLTAAIRFALAAAPDVLVVGGGLGTTHDDLTAECLAEVLGVPLREHPEALAMLEQRVRVVAERRRVPFDELFPLARRQALLPEGAAPLPPAGVAPGIAARSGSHAHLRPARRALRIRAHVARPSRPGFRPTACSRRSSRASCASSASASCRWARCWTPCRATCSRPASTSAGERWS